MSGLLIFNETSHTILHKFEKINRKWLLCINACFEKLYIISNWIILFLTEVYQTYRSKATSERPVVGPLL